MATKVFTNGDFRQIIVDNDYPTPYKVFYNNRWNYIQPEDDFINRLSPNEVYLYRFVFKVYNGTWVNIALLDNYYNKNEVRKSLFYKTITKENFSFKPRAVNFTELDARLGLDNLRDLFLSNESKKTIDQLQEDTANLENDAILYKLGTTEKYDEIEAVPYNKSEADNLTTDTEINLRKTHAELEYEHLNCDAITFYDTSAIQKNDVCVSNDFATSIRLLEISEKDTDIVYKAETLPDFTYDDNIDSRKDCVIVKNEGCGVVQDVICFDGTKPLLTSDNIRRNDFAVSIKMLEISEKDTDVVYKAETKSDFTSDKIDSRKDCLTVKNEGCGVVKDVIHFDGDEPLSMADNVERNDFCVKMKMNEVTINPDDEN